MATDRDVLKAMFDRAGVPWEEDPRTGALLVDERHYGTEGSRPRFEFDEWGALRDLGAEEV